MTTNDDTEDTLPNPSIQIEALGEMNEGDGNLEAIAKEIVSQNKNIMNSLTAVINSRGLLKGKNTIQNIQANIEKLEDVTTTFNQVNKHDRPFFMHLMKTDNLDSLNKKIQNTVNLLCAMTHDNRQYCLYIENELIPSMQEALAVADIEQVQEEKDVVVDIDPNLERKLAFLNHIVASMKLQREDKNAAFNLEIIMKECADGFMQNISCYLGEKRKFEIVLKNNVTHNKIPVFVDSKVANSVVTTLKNICKNSFEAEATQVNINYGFCRQEAEKMAKKMKEISIQVDDNGPGMKSILANRFFSPDRYMQQISEDIAINDDINKNRHEGMFNASGLLVKSGGHIAITRNILQSEDEENHGVGFEMIIPTLCQDLKPDLANKLGQNTNVLIIDDQKNLGLKIAARSFYKKKDADFKEFLGNQKSEFFIVNDYRVNYIFISDSTVALNIMGSMLELGASLDFVITDCYMPKLNGDELIRMMRDCDSCAETVFFLNTSDSKEMIPNHETLFNDKVLGNNAEGQKHKGLGEISNMVQEYVKTSKEDVDTPLTSVRHLDANALQELEVKNNKRKFSTL